MTEAQIEAAMLAAASGHNDHDCRAILHELHRRGFHIAALSAPPTTDAAGWQPIATCPDDLKMIWVWMPSRKKRGRRSKGQGVFAYAQRGYRDGREYTHWMHVVSPPPPSDQETAP